MTIIEKQDFGSAGWVVVVEGDQNLPIIQYCAGIIESVTKMPNGNYVVSGRPERNGIPPATIEQIISELEKLQL